MCCQFPRPEIRKAKIRRKYERQRRFSFVVSPQLNRQKYTFVIVFAKALRSRVQNGEITSTVRIWQRPHVKVGGAYSLGLGSIVIESIEEIGMEEITTEMATDSGFASIEDLLATAKHGPGERVFMIHFRFSGIKRDLSGK